MALRVWLPLNGNINNQGLDNFNISGSPTFVTSKMGQGLDLSKQITFTAPSLTGLKAFSCCFWYKVNSNTSLSGNWMDLICFNTSNGSTTSTIRSETCYSDTYKNVVNGCWYGVKSASLNNKASKDTWYHMAFTTDGVTNKAYLNGVLQVTNTTTSDYLGHYLTGYVRVGETNNIDAIMNDLRIYDHCLSPKEIKEISKGLVAHYKLDGLKANENLILRSDRVTSGSQASGITRIYMDDGTLKVVSTSGNGNYCSIGFAENSNTNVGNKLSMGDTYTISCDIKVEDGTAFPTLFINSGNGYKQLGGPVLKLNTWQRVYYTSTWNEPGTSYGNIALHLGFSSAIGTYYFKNFKLEKGTLTPWIPAPTDNLYISLGYANDICTDVSGNGYTAIKNGTLTFNTDSPRYSGSTKFDSGYFHKVPSPLNANSDAFTISCWFYPTKNATMCLINDRKVVGDGLAVFYLSSGIRFDTGSNYQWQVGSITVNAWNHIVVTWDKNVGSKKLYLNGNLINTTTNYGTLAQIGDVFSIGNSSANGAAGAGNQVYGSISDFRIYATALSADDILTMYKNSGIIDNKGNVYAYEFKEE